LLDSKVLVVLDEPEWTLGAIHLACAVVRSRGGKVVLLQMVPVRHPTYLGSDLAYLDFTFEQQRRLSEYQLLTSDYGVDFSVCVLPYDTYAGSLVDAAEQLGATVVFARFHRHWIPGWDALDRWWVERSLAHHGRELHTLEPPDGDAGWTPQLTFVPSPREVPSAASAAQAGTRPSSRRQGGGPASGPSG
jgi:hypothetical protein